MGFELVLRGTHRGTPRQVRSPFTGHLEMHSPIVMSESELQASIAVLTRHGARLDEDGGGLVRLDTSSLEFSGFNEEGTLVTLMGDLVVACRVVFELATAGQMVILPDRGDGLVTSAGALIRARDLEDEFGSRVGFVENVDALARSLSASRQ